MKKFLIYLCISFSLATTTVIAQKSEAPKYITSVEGIKEYTLNNGLQILLISDASQSNMIVNIVYKVGSKHEGYGEKGMAHLLEHMLFKSTKNLGDIKKMLSDKGGNANGTTWYDRTNYYEVFPYSEENLRWSLQMEADRMLNATLLQEDLDKEFSVVRNEFEIGENDPTRTLLERIVSAGYLWHNYGNSTIGSKEDIERVKTPQLRKFYEKYYQPNNAVLIIAGKFEEDKALKYIREYFSILPRPMHKLDEVYTVEPAQDGERFVEMRRAGDAQFIGAMYHTTSLADKDYAAIDVLKETLVSDPSGYLYKSMVEIQKTSKIWAFQPQVRDASYLYFNVDVPKDKNIEETKNIFRSELDKISTINYTDEDVERAKAKVLKDIENIKNNTIGFAVRLTEIVGAGDYRLGLLYRDNIEKITKEDIKRVAEKYFKANNRTVGVFIPSKDEIRVKSSEFLEEDITKLTANYKGKAEEVEAAPFEASISNLKKNFSEGKLGNGMKYGIINKQIKGNKVIASFQFQVSNAKDLENKMEIGDLLAKLIKSGTKSLTKEQIQDQLNNLKSSVDFQFSKQSLLLTVNTYKDQFEETMNLVEKLLTEANFPQNELTKTINTYTTDLEGALNDPQTIAFTEVERLTSNYPKSSIYYTPSIQEEIDAVKKVTQKDLVHFYQNIVGANNGIGTVIGLSDAKQVATVLEKTFGKWNSKSKYEKVKPTYTASKKDDKEFITPDKENAAAVGAVKLEMNRAHTDYPALVMANEMLGSGGFLSARIPQRLREKEGISYGAGSYISIPYDNEVASWSYYAFFNPTKKTEVGKAIKEEVAKALKDGFTEEELKSNIVSWKNNRNTGLGTDRTLLTLSNTYLLYDVSLDEFDNLEKKVDQLKLKDINTVLKKYIGLDKLTSIYAGDFNKK